MFEKNRGNLKPQIKKERTLLQKLWLPILVAIIDLAIIILLVILFKSVLAIVVIVILGHLIFLIYLTKTLEREKVSKDKEIIERKETEKQLHQIRKEIIAERQKRLEAENKIKHAQKREQLQQRKLISQITNIHELRDYIRETLSLKFSPKEIKEALLNAGWSEDKIDEIFEEVLK